MYRDGSSDIVSECVLEGFADVLRIHHALSTEALTKDKFEYALLRILNDCDVPAFLSDKCNPGHDITIRHERFSLKTQANRNIARSYLHISKFMELGKGAWAAESDLSGLREQFFRHVEGYDRVLQLRRIGFSDKFQEYELVEIPKALLLRAKDGELRMVMDSRQNPKPGYCTVRSEDGNILFELYFDGGTERKLQIKRLDKGQCIVHGWWKFSPIR